MFLLIPSVEEEAIIGHWCRMNIYGDYRIISIKFKPLKEMEKFRSECEEEWGSEKSGLNSVPTKRAERAYSPQREQRGTRIHIAH